MSSVDEVLARVDYARLGRQREDLYALLDARGSMGWPDRISESLEGLSHLLEALVDALVEDRVAGAEAALLSESGGVE